MKLKDIPYGTDFYWKGHRYRQFIRPKKPTRKAFTIICYRPPQGSNVEMPSGREVKPVIKTPLAN